MPNPHEKQDRKRLVALLALLLLTTGDDLAGLARQWGNATLDSRAFEREFVGVLYVAHAQAYALGAALATGQHTGHYPLDGLPLATLLEIHAGHTQADRDREYLTRFLATDYAGKPAAAASRARLYAARLVGTAQKGWLDTQPPATRLNWVLHAAESCEDCIDLADGGPYDASELTHWPGDGTTQCHTNCRCSLETQAGQKSFDFPEEPEDMKKRVQFALAAPIRQEGDYFIRTGKFFECDKTFTDMNGLEFSISAAEADTILPSYAGGNLNIEHMPTLFTEKFAGKLGKVRHLWRDGQDIMGEFALHKDIHNFFEGQPLEISSEWNVETKSPQDAALVVCPAVHDAVMMAAFAAVKQSPLMQEHHDLACRQGAECAGKAMLAEAGIVLDHKSIKMMKPEELAAVQTAHDHAAGNGASCDLYKTKKSMYYKQSAMQTLQDTGAAGKGRVMSAFDKLKALFRRAGASDDEINEGIAELTATASLDTKTEVKVVNFSETPEYRAFMAEQKKLQDANETLAQGLVQQQVAFAEQKAHALFSENAHKIEGYVRQMKLTPSEAEKWKELAKANPLAFSAALPTLEAREVNPALRGVRTGAVKITDGTDAGTKLIQMAQARAKADGISFKDAASKVALENPDLARAHSDSAPTYGREAN